MARPVKAGLLLALVASSGWLLSAKPVVPERSPERAAVIEKRAERRAFDGAPPTIPHAVDPRRTDECLDCHEEPTEVEDNLVAPGISHTHYTNCLQCHVTSVLREGALEPEYETTFVGREPPGPGQRAWPGAPPTIPHAIEMRSNCTNCHGRYGPEGLRTTHPARQNCLQCHALEQSAPPAL